jgi:peptidoglycan-associated lipoprotein
MERHSRIILPMIGLLILAVLTGCGASKGYVDQAISDERARSEAADANLQKDVKDNKAVLERMQSLTAQLEQKTDMAINEAKGFENYQVIWEGEIYYEFNSSELTVAAREIMDQAGDKMVVNRTSVMEIAGYCDPSGSSAYNLELGRKRASAAKYYLVDNYGINLFRIYMVSHGETKAVEAGDTSVSYTKQRKVMMKLWDKPGK